MFFKITLLVQKLWCYIVGGWSRVDFCKCLEWGGFVIIKLHKIWKKRQKLKITNILPQKKCINYNKREFSTK